MRVPARRCAGVIAEAYVGSTSMMMTNGPSQWDRAPAEHVSADIPLGDEAKQLLRHGMGVGECVSALVERKLFVDAVRLLARAISKAAAISWAISCAREVAGATPPPPTAEALRATQAWLSDPSEANRRAAMAAAEDGGLGTPAGCAALAVFFTGGSLAPPAAPIVPPAENLTAHAVASAVMLAACADQPERADERFRRFIARGIQIAHGGGQLEPSFERADNS